MKVHPLVAQTILHRAGDDGLLKSLEDAVKLLAAAVTHLDEQDPGDAARWIALLPHLQAIQRAKIQLPEQAESSLAQAAARVSMALLWGGRYGAALAVAESGLAREHGLPSDHPMVLGLRDRQASAWRFLGRYTEAEAEYRQVLDAELRVLGPDHPSTLATRYGIASVLAAQGKAADAAWADAYAEVHSYWQHVPGTPQNPLVFSNLHVYTDKWHNFVGKKAGNNGMPTNYICNQDTSSPSVALGKHYTFDTWGSTVLNTQFNPTCSSGAH